MADTDTASAAEEGASNERLVIGIAVNVLQGKGWIDEPDDALLDALGRLYRANPSCRVPVRFTAEILHDLVAARPGEFLAGAYEQECQERWEREEAERWSCPCGQTFGLLRWGWAKTDSYTLTEEGLFDVQVVCCPRCKRNLQKVREQHADGQLGFAF